MYADLFTVNRDQVVGLCNLIIKEGLKVKWTCNSRVDYVDEEMLQLDGQGGLLDDRVGHRIGQRADPQEGGQGLSAGAGPPGACVGARSRHQKLGLLHHRAARRDRGDHPGDDALAKKLPLDMALFHVAAPYPGTPFFFEVVENNWFRPGTQWEEVDMDQSTVLDYPGLKAEELLYWQKRAFREWAFRPGPI